MKKNSIAFYDKISLLWLTFKKNFYYTFNHKLNLHYGKKIRKLIKKRDNLDKKIYDKYTKSKSKYDKYIAYLQYKTLNKH